MKPSNPFHVESLSPVIPKVKSIAKMTNEIRIDAETTIIVLLIIERIIITESTS